MQHVAEFAAEALAALDHIAFHDNAAAQSGADDRGERGMAAVAAEKGEVAPERAGIAVVEIGNGFTEAFLQIQADIVSRPVGMDEIGGTLGAEDPGSAGRTRRIEAHGNDVGKRDAGLARGDCKAIFDLLEADIRPLFGEGRMFAQTLDEKLFFPVD